MVGTALAQFGDFVEATGPTYVTGPEDIVNDASKNTYSFGSIMGGDRGKKKMIQGGSEIRESIIFETGETFNFHLPGEERDWDNPQKLTRTRTFWRFGEAHMSWTRQEIMLNEKIRYGTKEARFQAYVDLRNEKETLMWTDKWNGMEEHMWRRPDATMEDEGGLRPYSIPAILNAHTNASLFTPGSAIGAAFATIQGINPADTALGRTGYQPQLRTYGTAIETNGDTFASDTLENGLDLLWMDLDFQSPPTMQEYFDNTRFNKYNLYCSTAGRAVYQHQARVRQDHFRGGPQDPAYMQVSYNGIPLKRVTELDTAPLYTQGTTNTTNEGVAAGGGTQGPRYYFVNSDHLYPVFHDQMYFAKDEVSRHHNDPDTFVCPVNTWYNVICTSRRKLGMLSPSADLYTNFYT